MVSEPWLSPSPLHSCTSQCSDPSHQRKSHFCLEMRSAGMRHYLLPGPKWSPRCTDPLDPANPLPGRYDAPRPCTAAQVEHRNSMSSVASSRYTRYSRDSMSSERSSVASYSSISSYGSNFVTAPTLVKTPWELERYKRHSIPRRTRPVGLLPPHVFQELPREIYDCILQQLQLLHFDTTPQVCPSCYLRDVRNLGLTSRAWDKAAREQL